MANNYWLQFLSRQFIVATLPVDNMCGGGGHRPHLIVITSIVFVWSEM